MLFNVWTDGQNSKSTIMAENEIAARQIFAQRYGWYRDEIGYWDFVNRLSVEKVY